MKALRVLYQGWGESWPLGTLAEARGRLYFEYSPQALAERLEPSPLKRKIQPGASEGVPGFVSDALPDGWGLFLMDKLFRQRGLNPASLSPLDRLSFIGNRAMGALSFEPGEVAEPGLSSLGLRAMAEESRKLVNDQSSEALRALAYWGGSPHGARPKVLVLYDQATDRMGTDSPSSGEPWLVKFPAQNEHPEVCAVEALYADLARRCQIEIPPTQLFEIDPWLSAFGVRRFDRIQQIRVPTLTLAAGLEVDFRIPSVVDYTGFLRMTRFLSRDEQETRKAFLRCVFNVVFHNRDDHPKNCSYLLTQGRRWVLSPAYDLTFSEGPGGEHHMDLCGEGRAPGRTHLIQVAQQADIKESVANDLIDRVCEVAGTLAATTQGYPIRRQTVESLVNRVEANRSRAG